MKAILVTLDCVRADHFDGSRGLTPGFERLRSAGTTFTQAIAQSQNTLSSHLTLLTSNYLFQHGVYSNHELIELPAHALPRRLATRGWACEAFASVEFLSRALADQIGSIDRRFNRPDDALWSRALQRLRGYPKRLPARRTLRDGLCWLDNQAGDRDCFLWLHLFDAHMVYSAPRRFLRLECRAERASRTCREAIRAAGWFCTDHAAYDRHVPLEHFPARYRAAVRYLDAQLCDFLLALQRRGWWDDVLLVVTADHGECLLGDHGLYCMHQKLFDTTVHVPLWIRFPGGYAAGTRVDALVELTDVAPTFAAAAGLVEALYMGRDLAAVARGDLPGRDFAFSEHVQGLLRAARDRDHIYVERDPQVPNRLALPLEAERLFLRDARPAPAEDRGAAERLRSAAESLLRSRPEVAAAWPASAAACERISEQLRGLGYL